MTKALSTFPLQPSTKNKTFTNQLEDKELTILNQCFRQLSELDEEERYRVLFWLNNRFSFQPPDAELPVSSKNEEMKHDQGQSGVPLVPPQASNGHHKCEDIGELLELLKPRTAADKVLITGYYLQEMEKEEALSGRLINDELKLLDEGVKNITATINTLIERDPPLMIQVRKKGSRPQSQKTYKVSKAGLQLIEEKIKSKGERP